MFHFLVYFYIFLYFFRIFILLLFIFYMFYFLIYFLYCHVYTVHQFIRSVIWVRILGFKREGTLIIIKLIIILLNINYLLWSFIWNTLVVICVIKPSTSLILTILGFQIFIKKDVFLRSASGRKGRVGFRTGQNVFFAAGRDRRLRRGLFRRRVFLRKDTGRIKMSTGIQLFLKLL